MSITKISHRYLTATGGRTFAVLQTPILFNCLRCRCSHVAKVRELTPAAAANWDLVIDLYFVTRWRN